MIITNGTYCVYLHTNRINGKMYVGQTVHGDDPNKRWAYGLGYRNSAHFWSAIQKYGWDNFDHEVIANNLTSDEANKFERLLIKKLNTMDEKYGYNLCSGNNDKRVLRKESLEKIRDASTKFYVWCFELNKLFYSTYDVQREMSVDRTSVSEACRGIAKSAGCLEDGTPMHWCFIEKDSLKDIEGINECINSLIKKWEYIVNNIILSNEKDTKGVGICKSTGKWRARITYNFKKYHLGTFNTREEAIQARLKAEKELYADIIKPKTQRDFGDLFKEFLKPKAQSRLNRLNIQKGEKGDFIKVVQKILNSKGYDAGTEDGIAGDKTIQAICNAAWDRLYN